MPKRTPLQANQNKLQTQLKQESLVARNNFVRPRNNMGVLHRRHK